MIGIIEWLKGKKTYLIGLAVVGWGIYQHFFGDQLSWPEVIDYIFSGGALMAVRAALEKIGLSQPSA